MTPKDLFNSILKVLGIYLSCVSVIPSGFAIYGWIHQDLSTFFFLLGMCLLLIALLYILRSQWAIKLFRPNKGFDPNRFDFSKTSTRFVVEIAMAIIGSLLFVKGIPVLLQEAILAFATEAGSGIYGSYHDIYDIYCQLLNMGVGIVVIALRNSIARLFASYSN